MSTKGAKTKSGRKVSRECQIPNDLGLHARAAAFFVKVASRFRSEIEVSKGDQKVNGKSIMGILTLAAAQGSSIKVTARGEDSEKAIQALGALIADGFGER